MKFLKNLFKKPPQYPLGLIGPDKTDRRDFIKVPLGGSPRPIDLIEEYFTSFQVRNQGQTNRCTGFAGAYGLEILNKKLAQAANANWDIKFSANDAYWYARKDKTKDEGAFLRDLMKGLATHGACHEMYWSDSKSPFKRPSDFDNIARFKIRTNYERVIGFGQRGLEDCINVLSIEKLPIFIGMTMQENATNYANRNGIYPIPNSRDAIMGGHAMVFVGWKEIHNKVYFKTLNSWGDKIGSNGYYWLPADLLESGIVFDLWTVGREYY